MRSYVILVDSTPDGGYGAWAPDLPGCVALGDTFDDCVVQMHEAVEFHLDGMREDGLPVPEPTTRAATVDAA